MAIYYATPNGLKKIQDKGESGVYFCPGRTNCLTYTPHNIDLDLDPLNVTVIGNPTINNGIIGGFSYDNYAKIDNTLSLGSNDFEIIYCINIQNTPSDYANAFNYDYTLALAITSQRQIHCNFGDGWNWLSDLTSTETLDIGKNYEVKVERKNNILTLFYKEKGATDYIVAGTREITYSIPATPSITIGNSSAIIQSSFPGTIDLKQSYIKINDVIWWKGGTGALTLKAGSKVYDGNGLFSTISSDVSLTPLNYVNSPHFLFIREDGTLYARLVSECESGTIIPTSGYKLFYNTTDKKIYLIENGVNVGCTSFPLAIVGISGGLATSINQIFQWCGYIGNTLFALPEVKGLIPNEYNEDKAYKNVEWISNNVVVRTFLNTDTLSGGVLGFNGGEFSRLSPATYTYSISENINKNSEDRWNYTVISSDFSTSSGAITIFTPLEAQTTNQLVSIGEMYQSNQLVYSVSQFTPGYVVTEIANPGETQNYTFEAQKGIFKIWLIGGGNADQWCYIACHTSGSAAGWIGEVNFKKNCFVRLSVAGYQQASQLLVSTDNINWTNLIWCNCGASGGSYGPGAGGDISTLPDNDFCTFQNVELSTNGNWGGSSVSSGNYGPSVWGGYGSGGINGYGKIEYIGKSS